MTATVCFVGVGAMLLLAVRRRRGARRRAIQRNTQSRDARVRWLQAQRHR